MSYKLIDKIARRYIVLMDKIISSKVGGEKSPAFFDIKTTYPSLLKIDENFEIIRQELEALLLQRESIRLVHETIEGHDAILGWRILYIYCYGINAKFPNQDLFPNTSKIIKQIPNVVDAWFSILEPKKPIKAHRGAYRGFIRYHIAFKVPQVNPPQIRVKDQFYTWKEGESILFDDRHDHQVYNESDDIRVVLIVDVMRPLTRLLHFLNTIAIRCLINLYVRPALQNKTLELKGEIL
jgi:aspartyl/asparaginyl beta-hydroxylase (cupin superfamily)